MKLADWRRKNNLKMIWFIFILLIFISRVLTGVKAYYSGKIRLQKIVFLSASSSAFACIMCISVVSFWQRLLRAMYTLKAPAPRRVSTSRDFVRPPCLPWSAPSRWPRRRAPWSACPPRAGPSPRSCGGWPSGRAFRDVACRHACTGLRPGVLLRLVRGWLHGVGQQVCHHVRGRAVCGLRSVARDVRVVLPRLALPAKNSHIRQC